MMEMDWSIEVARDISNVGHFTHRTPSPHQRFHFSPPFTSTPVLNQPLDPSHLPPPPSLAINTSRTPSHLPPFTTTPLEKTQTRETPAAKRVFYRKKRDQQQPVALLAQGKKLRDTCKPVSSTARGNIREITDKKARRKNPLLLKARKRKGTPKQPLSFRTSVTEKSLPRRASESSVAIPASPVGNKSPQGNAANVLMTTNDTKGSEGRDDPFPEQGAINRDDVSVTKYDVIPEETDKGTSAQAEDSNKENIPPIDVYRPFSVKKRKALAEDSNKENIPPKGDINVHNPPFSARKRKALSEDSNKENIPPQGDENTCKPPPVKKWKSSVSREKIKRVKKRSPIVRLERKRNILKKPVPQNHNTSGAQLICDRPIPLCPLISACGLVRKQTNRQNRVVSTYGYCPPDNLPPDPLIMIAPVIKKSSANN